MTYKHLLSAIYIMALGLISSPSYANGTTSSSTAQATKSNINLVMFEEDGCAWCEKWMEEIGEIYPITDEGKLAPLKRVNIHDRDNAPYDKLKGIYFTPTFVVMENGEELGRITGYPSEHFFWPLLAEILEKSPSIK